MCCTKDPGSVVMHIEANRHQMFPQQLVVVLVVSVMLSLMSLLIQILMTAVLPPSAATLQIPHVKMTLNALTQFFILVREKNHGIFGENNQGSISCPHSSYD